MIIGKLNELKMYLGLNKNLDKAINYVMTNDLNQIEKGKSSIDGVDLMVIREEYQPRPINQCYLEGHKNYIDLQIVLKGSEYFGYCNIDNPNLTVMSEYNPDKDVAKYDVLLETTYHMTDGSFAICYPNDLHMPKCQSENIEDVIKIIFKVKLN